MYFFYKKYSYYKNTQDFNPKIKHNEVLEA